jgi:SAM-dependent methyltransferase
MNGFTQGQHLMNANVTIHDAVQAHYGSIALEQAGCGCGPDCCGPDNGLYEPALLEDLPEEVTGLSLGCGDPVSIAGLKPGDVVLDLGSGGGIDCFLAARQVGASGFVIGVDMTPAMLARANENKARLGMQNVEFRAGKIESLPVEANTVDVAMSNCVINLSPDKSAVFHELVRVLKPGGRVSISDIVTEGEFSEGARADLTLWSECVTGAIDANDYVRLMADAGFADITVVDKADADGLAPSGSRSPRVYSARITATKPAV